MLILTCMPAEEETKQAISGDLEPACGGDMTVGAFVSSVADRYGSREAIVDGDRRLSFVGLAEEVESVARALVKSGVRSGSRVALVMGNTWEFAVSLFAVCAIGAVGVPINTFAMTDERHWTLAHAEVSALLTMSEIRGHHYVADLVAHAPGLVSGASGALYVTEFPSLRSVVVLGSGPAPPWCTPWDEFMAAGQQVPRQVVSALRSAVSSTDPAMILYTSGSTDRPKAVVHRQRAFCIQSQRVAELMDTRPEDRVWSALPLFWTAGLVMGLGSSLASGATTVLQESFDPPRTLDLLERERVTTIHAPPHIAARLADQPDIRERDLSALVRMSGRSPLPAVLGRTGDAWDPVGAYGLSETFTVVTGIPADADPGDRGSSKGPLLPGVKIRIVGSGGEDLPAGEVGEIAVWAPTMMCGYYKADPGEGFDDHGYVQTGDAGFLDAGGLLHWEGRQSGIIRTGGVNVSPYEVETALTRWKRVELAQVVGVPHPTLGEEIVAFIVARQSDPVTAEDVLHHLRSTLAAYKVPRHVLFVSADDLAMTGTEKVRAAAARLLAQRILAAAAESTPHGAVG
jgi:acyl-CoA synthetase (AMP-forming)/AMP-acid ligase II